MFGSKVRAGLAAFSGPGMPLLEGHLVVGAVPAPDLEDAFDIDLGDVCSLQPVLRFEKLLEDGVVEGLRAHEPYRQCEPPPDLAGLASPHHDGGGGLATHPHQGYP